VHCLKLRQHILYLDYFSLFFLDLVSLLCFCYQRVSIASCAKLQTAGIAREGMSVCHTPVLYQNEARVVISSPSESLNFLVSRNIWFITKFERGHPEQGRFMRLGWVKMAILTIFRPINHHISETMQYRTKVAVNH